MADGSSGIFNTTPQGISGGFTGLVLTTYPGGGGINATGKKYAFCGPVWFQERTGTKAIRRVGFRWGTVTKAGGSAMTVSLQNVSTAATPIQPDETQDQTVAVTNADAAFVSNTWYRTGALSADRTVAFGEMLAVVIEYDGAGRLGSDQVNLAHVAALLGSNNSTISFKSGGVWTASPAASINLVLEFSDGTFGTMAGGFPCSAVGALSYNSGTGGADEYALEIKFTKDVDINLASWAIRLASASADYEFIIYDGTTAIATCTLDGGWRSSTTTIRAINPTVPAAITLTANTLYRLAIRPTTANPVEVYYHDVNDVNHWVCHVGGADWKLTSRLDQGAWAAATTTRRLFIFPHTVFEFAVEAPPAPDASWPCNTPNPIFFGATSDVNGNVMVFGDKTCRDASTYYGGYKPPRILDIGNINRVASDFLTGGWPAQTTSMRLADTDYLFRNMSVQPSLIKRTAWIYAYSEAIRAVQGNPTLLFHGPIQNDPFTENLTYTLQINDYIGSQYGLLKPDLLIPQRTISTTYFPGCPNRNINKGEPIIGGVISKTDGALKGINVGIINVGGTDYVVALVAGHACAGGIANAYDSSGTPLNWGTDAFAPGQTGWTTIQPGGELYWDISDRRYTLIFIDAASTVGIDFIAGTTDIYINTSGLEPNGNGTGTVITDLLTLYKYLMVQFITQSYLKGAYLPGLQFEFFPGMGVGYDVVDEASWDAASAQSAIYLGGGFIGGFVIGAGGRQQSVRDILQGANTSCNVFMGVNANSQLIVRMFNNDRATLLGSTRTITARRDILSQPRFILDKKWEWFGNDFAYQYNANYRDDGRGAWDGFDIQGNAPSVVKYGAVTTRRQYPLIGSDDATADAVAGLQLAMAGPDPPIVATWAQSLCGMSFDILTGAPMTCYPGRGTAGWVNNAVFIIGQSLNPNTRKVTFTAIDVEGKVS